MTWETEKLSYDELHILFLLLLVQAKLLRKTLHRARVDVHFAILIANYLDSLINIQFLRPLSVRATSKTK